MKFIADFITQLVTYIVKMLFLIKAKLPQIKPNFSIFKSSLKIRLVLFPVYKSKKLVFRSFEKKNHEKFTSSQISRLNYWKVQHQLYMNKIHNYLSTLYVPKDQNIKTFLKWVSYKPILLFNIRSWFILLQLYYNLTRFISKLFTHFLPVNLHYVWTLLVILIIDACLTDDEPLMEPIEWSMFQSWLLFIFSFAWIAENLITSRYGRYVGRDKRVWLGWFKSFWLIESFYALNYGAASIFVIVPFYNEITYSLFFIVSWWNWYTRTFFFKFIS